MSSNSDLQTLPDTTPSVLELPDIIQRYRSGESIQDIAKECAVSARTIYRWMLSGLGDKDYQDLVTECLVDRIADADMQLGSATDACQIARARETARFARMDFERRRPNLYGQKQQDTNEKVIVIVNRSNDDRNTQTIDVSPQQITDGN